MSFRPSLCRQPPPTWSWSWRPPGQLSGPSLPLLLLSTPALSCLRKSTYLSYRTRLPLLPLLHHLHPSLLLQLLLAWPGLVTRMSEDWRSLTPPRTPPLTVRGLSAAPGWPSTVWRAPASGLTLSLPPAVTRSSSRASVPAHRTSQTLISTQHSESPGLIQCKLYITPSENPFDPTHQLIFPRNVANWFFFRECFLCFHRNEKL